MSVRIRLTRVGRPKDPIYRLVATDRRQARDAEPIEVLGVYNPRGEKKPGVLNLERLRYWISTGAQPSDSVLHMLRKNKLWDQVKPGSTAAADATK